MKDGVLRDIYRLRILFLPKDKLRFAALFLLMLVASVLEAIGIGIIPAFVSFLLRPDTLQEMPWLGEWTAQLPSTPTASLMITGSLALLVFMASKSVVQGLTYYSQCRLTNRLQVRVSCRMFETYQAAPYEWLLQRSSSELQRNILVDVSQVINGIVMPVLDVIMAMLMGFCIAIAMILSTTEVTLIGAFLTGLGVVAVVRAFRARLDQAGVVAREETSTIIEAIQHGFGALVDARIAGRHHYLLGRFRKALTMQARMLTRRTTITYITPLAIEVIAMAGLLIVFLLISIRAETVTDSIPTMTLLAVATIRLKQIATRVAAKVNMINTSRPSIPTLLHDVHTLNSLRTRRRARHKDTAEMAGSFEQLAIENVVYTYPNAAAPAVRDVTLTIRRGESIGFAGETGGGKSTLIGLMLGLLEPQSGSIRVNGADIFAHLDAWYRQLAYVPQTIFLLDDSIRANIAFGIPPDEIDRDQLAIAVEAAQLTRFVEELPNGLDSLVGERGVRVSGGQRQRIGLARALFLDPEVLILDEATSALDSTTEEAVMKAVCALRPEMTRIMIAHRLTSLEGCDRLYHVDGGRLTGQEPGPR
jgi:ATP-binding cassette subfamily C protein